jgi:hypothetical protein
MKKQIDLPKSVVRMLTIDAAKKDTNFKNHVENILTEYAVKFYESEIMQEGYEEPDRPFDANHIIQE